MTMAAPVGKRLTDEQAQILARYLRERDEYEQAELELSNATGAHARAVAALATAKERLATAESNMLAIFVSGYRN